MKTREVSLVKLMLLPLIAKCDPYCFSFPYYVLVPAIFLLHYFVSVSFSFRETRDRIPDTSHDLM